MRIAIVTAGAGGMFCGSCMKDNTLASELIRQGHDALLIPTYTPITTDETDVSAGPIQFGGINVFLQQSFWLFRHTPAWLDRLWDRPWLLRWVSRFAVKTQAADLGDMTLSMLDGENGKQRKELRRFLSYLKKDVQPDVVLFSNVLLSGLSAAVTHRLKVPVYALLQGDDVFLDLLPADFRAQAKDKIRHNMSQLTGCIATSSAYADYISGYFGLPRETIRVILPGINTRGHGQARPERPATREEPGTIGYFARIAPEKGLHLLVDAFILLRKRAACPRYKLRISGWLGGHQQAYFDEQKTKLEAAGLLSDVEYVDSPDQPAKIRFLQSIDVLSVPTVFIEPKGLYVLEALANQVPVVQPAHGSFPEILAETGGGLLVKPNDAEALAEGLWQMLHNPNRSEEASQAQIAVFQKFGAERMARETLALLRTAGANSLNGM